MSDKKHTSARLAGSIYPVFPVELPDLLKAQVKNKVTTFSSFEEVAKLMPEFVSCETPTTSDSYLWFCGMYFTETTGRVAVLFPWKQDFNSFDGDTSDRSIAVYINGYVNIDSFMARLIEAFYQYGKIKKQ